MQVKVNFLGHVICGERIATDQEKFVLSKSGRRRVTFANYEASSDWQGITGDLLKGMPKLLHCSML